MMFRLAALAAFLASVSAQRTFTVQNQCAETLWIGLFTSAGPVPSQKTGWEMATGATTSFQVAQDWNGRLWPRTGCDFSSGSTLPDTCVTGGCNGGLLCENPGVPPATLVEWNIASDQDWYDVSNVDGANVPVALTLSAADCTQPKCDVDLREICPEELAVKDGSGKTVGCKSDCLAFGTEETCCSGAHATPETCPVSGLPNFDFWHTNCPTAYVYAYDDTNALFTCPTSEAADYTVTFCP